MDNLLNLITNQQLILEFEIIMINTTTIIPLPTLQHLQLPLTNSTNSLTMSIYSKFTNFNSHLNPQTKFQQFIN